MTRVIIEDNSMQGTDRRMICSIVSGYVRVKDGHRPAYDRGLSARWSHADCTDGSVTPVLQHIKQINCHIVATISSSVVSLCLVFN